MQKKIGYHNSLIDFIKEKSTLYLTGILFLLSFLFVGISLILIPYADYKSFIQQILVVIILVLWGFAGLIIVKRREVPWAKSYNQTVAFMLGLMLIFIGWGLPLVILFTNIIRLISGTSM
jgi:hypothetical protein